MAEAAQTNSLPTAVAASSSQFDRLFRYLVVGVLGLVAFYLIAAFGLAFFWIQRPFLGVFLENRSTANNVRPLDTSTWPYLAAGGERRDQILFINGAAATNANSLAEALEPYHAGDTVQVEVLRKGEKLILSIQLIQFPFADVVNFFLIPYAIAWAYLGIGFMIFRLRYTEMSGRLFALFCAMTAGALGGTFDLWTTHTFMWLWIICIGMTGGALFSLALVLPDSLPIVVRFPLTRLLPLLPVVGFSGYALWNTYSAPDPYAYVQGLQTQYVYVGFGALSFFALMLYRWRFHQSPNVREQSGAILGGSLLAFTLIVLWFCQPLLNAFLGTNFDYPFVVSMLLFPLVAFPIFIAVALMRYRLLDTDARLSLFMSYALMVVITIVGYTLIVWGLGLLLSQVLPNYDFVLMGLFVFGLVLAFNPLRNHLQRLINYTFFRTNLDHQQRLEEFGRSLTSAVTLNDIARAIRTPIDEALRPAHIQIFLRDPVNNDYAAFVDATLTGPEARRFRADVRFAADGPLATTLSEEKASIYLSPNAPFPPKLQRDRTRLALLGSTIYTALPGKNQLIGWLSIGPKMSGELVSTDDLRFVEAIADQAALAVERAAVISDLERRVRELNVVSQMSQAVNFTQTYDDLLELIYAQASRIVDTRNFFIVLKDARGKSFSYAFYQENNERDSEQEEKSWPAGRGLSSEVMRTGQPIRTDDYHAECRRRNVPPRPKAFKAWMGVPLNAGAETIGLMSVASFDPSLTFTEDQMKIFWTIADQAASAIVKAQLYQQTEQRARQLATLNEVSTSMASNLDLDTLLQRIIESSMEILGCVAGSLFLTDHETGEYVFRVASGPVGQNLVGMRLAPGRGLVGEAMESGVPLIVNDAQNDPRLFKGTDQSTGFVTQALMVVPLRRGDHSIGAIEVINKHDQTIFTDDDKNLLTAFAGQAAVAIENARLFTQTDQALTERVEELSVLQRIDRELNTALDMQKVMDITLDWALRQAEAYAGSVGIVQEDGIQILATRGYGDQSAGKLLPLDEGIMGRVIKSGEPSVVDDVITDPDYRGQLVTTRSQLTIPIKRGEEITGIMNLESPREAAFKEEVVAFVSRLLDHASVAITNAGLFAEVRAANHAKSEFVSTAAHELKTPMTAIKMSADLLNSGAVGPVNDTQKQFLGTIRNNLERMNTIVSDLNDITRIETGRMRVEIKAINFPALVDDVLRATKHLLDSKKQVLQMDIQPDLPLVLADPSRASQILINLLSNAYKYTQEGGHVGLRIAEEPHVEAGGPRLMRVSVKDNGIGMTPEDLQKLFTKFFRSSDRAAREAPGTGLGLSIVKNLVELQGGKIWVESEFRKGTTFHFTLPLETIPTDTPAD